MKNREENTMKTNQAKATPYLTDDFMMATTIDDFDMNVDKKTFEKCLDTLQSLGFIEKRVSGETYYLKPVASKIIEAFKSTKGNKVKKRK